MQRTDVLVVGAGQAGLAMSHCLSARGIAHVVLERGRVGESWRSERWDSLRLLTPNWMSRLPGHGYSGPDPDGFMARDEVIAMLDDYARRSRAPVVGRAPVRALAAVGDGYRVETEAGGWLARAVVVATGACGRPRVPGFAAALPAGIVQVTPDAYRRPADLPDGGVLVVGGSSTGLQLAQEIHASGRPVTLAVGRHLRMVAPLPRPRHLRLAGAGRDHRRELAAGPGHRRRPAAAVDAALGPRAARSGAAGGGGGAGHRPAEGHRRRAAGARRRTSPSRLRRLGCAAAPGARPDRRGDRRLGDRGAGTIRRPGRARRIR